MLIIIEKFLSVNGTDVLLLYIVTVDVTDGLLLGYLNYYQTTLRIRDAHMMKLGVTATNVEELGVTATDFEVSEPGVALGCDGWLPSREVSGPGEVLGLPSLAFSSREVSGPGEVLGLPSLAFSSRDFKS